MTKDNVYPEAELAFQRHLVAKGTATLVAWYKAEVQLLPDSDSKERQQGYSDVFLVAYQDQVEHFATAYRTRRLTADQGKVAA
jgi:hypothetical protein